MDNMDKIRFLSILSILSRPIYFLFYSSIRFILELNPAPRQVLFINFGLFQYLYSSNLYFLNILKKLILCL